jgi:hypothetical protein
MGKYEDLLKTFDGTLASVPQVIEEEIIDLYAESGNAEALEGQHDIPIEMIRVVLEQPDLMQKALARRAGGYALQFVNEVLPAVIAKAASGETGSIQAAKLVADVIGATKGRGSVGRPKGDPEEESGPGLEEKLTAIAQATTSKKGKARSRLTPKGKR